MPKPKGFKKSLLLNKTRIGKDRRDDLLEDVRENTAYLPKGVMLEDLDRTFVEFANDELAITIDGEKVPVIFLTLQRWAEFSKTWQKSDQFGKVEIPFITVVRRPDVQQGENQGGYWNVAGQPTFNYLKVPNNKNGRTEIDIYKIPQPTPVDVTYEVRFFGNKMRSLNKINLKIQQLFKSRQHYIRPNEHFMPLHLEAISDESEINDINARRYYVQLFEIKLLGYLLDEDDFEVTPAINRVLLMNELNKYPSKPSFKATLDKYKTEITYDVTVFPDAGTILTTTLDFDTNFDLLTDLVNVASINIFLDDNPVSVPFTGGRGQVLKIDMDKPSDDLKSEYKLKGKLI